MNERTPIFSATVAGVALDLADYHRLHAGNNALSETQAAAAGHMPAGGVIVAKWFDRIESCLDSIAIIRDLIRSDSLTSEAGGQRGLLSVIREEVLNVEEVLSATLDEQREAVWTSLPKLHRVKRFRALLDQMQHLSNETEHAPSRSERASTAEMCQMLQQIIDERASLDPETAALAGYEPFAHETVPDVGRFSGRAASK